MPAAVSTVWDTETKVKVEALQQVTAEVVSLHHPGSIPNRKFHPVGEARCKKELWRFVRRRRRADSRGSRRPQSEEGWREPVAPKAAGAGIGVSGLLVLLWEQQTCVCFIACRVVAHLDNYDEKKT